MSAAPTSFQSNMDFLTEKNAYTKQANVVHEPEETWVSQAIAAFSESNEAPLKMDETSKTLFQKGIPGNAFTGLVEIAQKTLYLFPLAANPSYGNTDYPAEQVGLPGIAGAGGATAAPLPHNPTAGAPSHQVLASKLGKEKEGGFIGFAVQKLDDGSGKVSTVTSRSQNREGFKRKPGGDPLEHIQVELDRRNIRKEGREGQEKPGVLSEVASENWTRLIVKTIVVNLRKTV